MKEWIKVTVGPSGSFVTVTLQEGTAVAKCTEKTFRSQIKQSVKRQRKQASELLDEIKEAMEWQQTTSQPGS